MPVTFTIFNDPSALTGTTQAFGINDTDQIVGTYADASGITRGFLYSGGTFTTLAAPLGINGTFAHGINDMGQIVGSYNASAAGTHGFLLSGGTYTTLDDPLGAGTEAFGINASGHSASKTRVNALMAGTGPRSVALGPRFRGGERK